jgi:hypothetical protein
MFSNRNSVQFPRRDFLKVGACGFAGLSLASYLRYAAAHHGHKHKKAESAIVVFLGGGPTQLDTFDMKPDAPAEYRGEFKPIDTNVPGLRICEHLPLLARQADKFAVLRASHTQAAHELATNYLSTGNRPVPSVVYPGYGAVVSKELTGEAELPHFVAIPQTAQSSGYLGVRYAPLATQSTPKAGVPFDVRGIALADGLAVEQFEKNEALRRSLDTGLDGAAEYSKAVDGLDRFAQQAHDIIASPKARKAFDVSREPTEVADRFGTSKFPMSCLLAARLIEAGVRFTTVSFGGWDTHNGPRHRRVRPYPEDQRTSRPRPLAPLDVHAHGRRRHPRRRNPRHHGRQEPSPHRRPDHARRRRRDVLSHARHRQPEGIPHGDRKADHDRA